MTATAAHAADNDQQHPWLQPLSPEAREVVRRNVETAPPLSDRQRQRLRNLFRG